jgi:hypothetical protein
MAFMVWPLTARLDGASELDERAAAHELDDPARMGGDLRIDKFAAQCL